MDNGREGDGQLTTGCTAFREAGGARVFVVPIKDFRACEFVQAGLKGCIVFQREFNLEESGFPKSGGTSSVWGVKRAYSQRYFRTHIHTG